MNKAARIEFKVSSDKKVLFEKTAKMMGVTLTDFAINAMTKLSKKIINEHHVIQLSLYAQKAFAEALLNPPEPSDKLKQAYQQNDEDNSDEQPTSWQ